MKCWFLLVFYILQFTIADYSRIDISDGASLDYFNPKKGYIVTVEVLIIKVPDELTVQTLFDDKLPVWRSLPTEALKEVCVYYQGNKKFGLYVYSIDYFSSPNESFYIYKWNKWISASQNSFDSLLYHKAVKLKLG